VSRLFVSEPDDRGGHLIHGRAAGDRCINRVQLAIHVTEVLERSTAAVESAVQRRLVCSAATS